MLLKGHNKPQESALIFSSFSIREQTFTKKPVKQRINE